MSERLDHARDDSRGERRRFYRVIGISAVSIVIVSIASIGFARAHLAQEQRRAVSTRTANIDVPTSAFLLARSRGARQEARFEGEPALPYTEAASEGPGPDRPGFAEPEIWLLTDSRMVSRGSRKVFVGGTAVTGRVIRATARRAGNPECCTIWMELGTYTPNPRQPHEDIRYELTGYWEIVGPEAGGPGSADAIRGRLSGVYPRDPLQLDHLTADVTLVVPTVDGTLAEEAGRYVGTGRGVGRLVIPRPLRSPLH